MSADKFIRAAYAYLYIGDFEEAKAAFARAIEEEPTNPEPYFCASITAHRSGEYEEAERFVLEALRLDPSALLYQTHLKTVRASRWLDAGVNAYIKGNVSDAIACCKKALDIDPLHEAAQAQLDEIRRNHPVHLVPLGLDGYTEEDVHESP